MAKRILIVDDSPAIRETLRSLVDRHPGWKVCGEAVNGVDALAKAKELFPDVVVLDVSMPLMDGLEAARQLKRILPSLSIVMFTSYESEYLQHEAATAGIEEVVSKSSSPTCLINAIERTLHDGHTHPGAAQEPPRNPEMKAVDAEAKAESTAVPVRYGTGQAIPVSGIYMVFHEQHRLPHEVTLLEGETFPRCAKCGNLVEFVLDQSVPAGANAAQFPIRAFALPDLDEAQLPNPLSLGLPRL